MKGFSGFLRVFKVFTRNARDTGTAGNPEKRASVSPQGRRSPRRSGNPSRRGRSMNKIAGAAKAPTRSRSPIGGAGNEESSAQCLTARGAEGGELNEVAIAGPCASRDVRQSATSSEGARGIALTPRDPDCPPAVPKGNLKFRVMPVDLGMREPKASTVYAGNIPWDASEVEVLEHFNIVLGESMARGSPISSEA